MKVASVSGYLSRNQVNLYPQGQKKTVTHSKNVICVPPGIVFKGTPLYMNLSYDSIVNYNNLSNGSYLDIHDDRFAPINKSIRSHNLSFLDNVISDYDKNKFIENFKFITKFPNLVKVSENIENEYIRSINAVANEFDDYKYDVIAAGYDQTCSVGKRKALPGSDLDKPFIIIRGDENRIYDKDKDEEIVNNFKSKLWYKTDQRILSYNHDTSFPTIMTINQVKDTIEKINNITDKMYFNRQEMEKNVQEEYYDLIKASKFNILLAAKLPKKKYDDKSYVLNKENVKNFAYFIESVRDGKKVIKTRDFNNLIDKIKSSDFYKYSNVAQMQAMKNAIDCGREEKSKIRLRRNLENDFNSWNTSKKFEFIKTLIKYSSEDQNNFNEYFANDRNIKEIYKPLIGILCYGDENRRLNPEYIIKNDYIDLYLSKDKPVRLYRGFIPNVLWIESMDKNDIEDTLLHIEEIKKTTLFQNIDRVQCPLPYSYEKPDAFYEISYYTDNGHRIIERFL